MSKDLVPIQPEKTDAFSRIVNFMSKEESGIVLSATEEKMLARWMYCHALLKERKFRDEDIIDKITDKFECSRITARNDISQTRSLFVRLTKDLKKYGMIHHIQDLEIEFQKRKTDKAYAPYLHRLADAITKAYAALPDEVENQEVLAPTIIVNVVQGQSVESAMNVEEALKAADELIDLEKNHEYTDFEDLTDESKS